MRANIGGHVERLYPGAVLDYWATCDADAAAGDFVLSQQKDTFLNLDNENINLTVQWDSAGEVGAFDNLNFKVIASTHQTDYEYLQDRDFSSFSIDAIGTAGGARDRQTDSRRVGTIELQAAGSAHGTELVVNASTGPPLPT